MRTLLLQLHLYAGLLCSSYFVLFGVSSLNYNHRFGTAVVVDHVAWERHLDLPAIADDGQRADAVRDSLGLPGWTPWWRFRTDADGVFHFELTRPGKEYDLHLHPDGRLQVEAHRTGLWPVIDRLHGMMGMPNAPLLSWWGAYTELSFWVLLASAASGVYLWTRRRHERRVGTWLLVVAAGGSLSFMVYIYAVG